MQLVINTYGAYLQRRGELFQVKADGKVSEVSARKVQSILITTGAAFSTDAVQLATEKNIDILFLDKYGDPFGRVWHRSAWFYHDHTPSATGNRRGRGRVKAGIVLDGSENTEPN